MELLVGHMANSLDDTAALKIIAERLSNRKNLSALSNYQVLNNNILYVNNVLNSILGRFLEISGSLKKTLEADANASSFAKTRNSPLYYFRQILPRLIENDIQISVRFSYCTSSDDRSGIQLENVNLLNKSFTDYIELVTTTRQFVDSLVSDSYQLICLEPKKLNYQVLSSLSSFQKYATKSIWNSIATDDLTNLLQEFNSLEFNERANSPISRCQHKTFAQKIDFIFSTLQINEGQFKDELKNIFSFSSDFTHVGYVSTMFSSTYESECIFGDEIGPYFLIRRTSAS